MKTLSLYHTILLVFLHDDVNALPFSSTTKTSPMTPNTSRISELPKTASLEGRRVLQRFGDSKRTNIRSFVQDPIVTSRLSAKESEDDLNDNLKLGDDGQAICKQGMASATFNLVKANVGSGILALPAGVAAFADVPSALIPAVAVMCLLGFLSAYSFYMIPRLSRMDDTTTIDGTRRTMSISQAWEKEVGKDSAWIVSLFCFLTPLGTALTYSIIAGDMLSMLAKSMGMTGKLVSRQSLLIATTLGIIYPLCTLKSLAALSPVSMVGVTGMCLTAIFMVLRALPSSPYAIAGSAFLESLPISFRPSFGIVGNNALSPAILVLVSMTATSMLVHFSAHDFCDDLRENTPERFQMLTTLGFSFTALINIIFMGAGFLTFGANCQSMVLNNYSPYDFGATISRLIVVISLIGSYPLLFRAIKSSFFELTHKGRQVSEKFNKITTRYLLAIVTGTALVVTDAGIVVSLSGAVMGSAIIYAFPSIVFLKTTSRLISQGKLRRTSRLAVERFANKCLVGTGGLIAVLGGAVILIRKFRPGLM